MRRSRWPEAFATCLVAAALACGAEAPVARGRALVVGIDGASFAVLRPLLEDGRLPHLEALARDGVSGPLRSMQPLVSPRIWTTVATGRRPSDHGILGWMRLDAPGRPRLYSSSDRRVPAVWNILSHAGRRVAVVNWLQTYPPERIEGVMVSDHAEPDAVQGRLDLVRSFASKHFPDVDRVLAPAPDAPLAWPEPWSERVAELRSIHEPLTRFPDPFRDGRVVPVPELRAYLSGVYEADGWVTRSALAIDEAADPDLVMVYLPGIDRVSHFLWGDLDARHLPPGTQPRGPVEAAAGAAALEGYYEYTDALLGLLLARFGREDLVLVLSDHGFETKLVDGSLAGGHQSHAALEGVLFARGAGIPAGGPAGEMSILEITPTLLAWFGLPAARDMPGRPAPFLGPELAARVESYDDVPVERVGGAPSGAEDAILERLRAVGYVE